MLTLAGVNAYYGRLHVLKGVALHVGEREIVALLGANGAGKSTTLHTICGLLRPSSGKVSFAGEDVTGLPAEALVRRGITLVPEGRKIFGSLSVRDNLLLGAYTRSGRSNRQAVAASLERVFEMFPFLRERQDQRGGSLSGGEQQMLAIGRALMSEPRLLLLDEPCLGLAPRIAQQIIASLSQLRDEGVTLLLVEQNARAALSIADRGYVMETGKIVLEGTAQELLRNREVQRAYLGRDYDEV
ncbi:MAG: ABC transporter ATP-binding protein [Armatimonadetes bacterium]|nr:ABC transporter ATP-binding protein [Armatimonadota bacterium]